MAPAISDAAKDRVLPWHMGSVELIDGAVGKALTVAVILVACDEQPFTVTIAE